jgi:hypothetical protein|tara:strand:- start:284 stop:847 length:564 start_codon:yes stop_codon:yes gene_type:complete
MRSFTEILLESKKTYSFKIGYAGALPEGIEDDMETCLQKFELISMSAGKATPIQERPLDFPQLQNMEVTYWEAEMNYPTTSQVLQEYIADSCGCNQAYFIVRNMNDPREDYQADSKTKEPYETKLETEDMGGESAQDKVGDSRVMDLLKELETARSERIIDPTAGTPKGESADIGDTENTKSPVGGV